MKKFKIILLLIFIIVVSVFIGYKIDKINNEDNSKEPKLYLPIYEYNSAIDGKILYDNASEDEFYSEFEFGEN